MGKSGLLGEMIAHGGLTVNFYFISLCVYVAGKICSQVESVFNLG